jgi:hypothetical protein
VNQERKISVLRNLLDRVQKRATAPRVAATTPASPSFPAATPASPAPPMAITAPSAQPATSGRPGSSTLPLNFTSREVASAPPAPEAMQERPGAASSRGFDAGAASSSLGDRGPSSAPEDEADEGPPSAPRLREVPEVEASAEEHDIDEEEPQLKTPPPESGRQHVTPGPAATVSEPEEDISITVTMEESEAPPSVESLPPQGEPVPLSANQRQDFPELSAPQPRLALVSEPEIELHGMTPISSPVEPVAPVPPSATPSGVRPATQPIAPPAPPPAPPAPAFARTAPSFADTRPSAAAVPPAEPAAASPPVRMMAQPLNDASGKTLPPVEVWASTFAPAALRGQVASFVGQNANFEPKTFGELVRASIALGGDKP